MRFIPQNYWLIFLFLKKLVYSYKCCSHLLLTVPTFLHLQIFVLGLRYLQNMHHNWTVFLLRFYTPEILKTRPKLCILPCNFSWFHNLGEVWFCRILLYAPSYLPFHCAACAFVRARSGTFASNYVDYPLTPKTIPKDRNSPHAASRTLSRSSLAASTHVPIYLFLLQRYSDSLEANYLPIFFKKKGIYLKISKYNNWIYFCIYIYILMLGYN